MSDPYRRYTSFYQDVSGSFRVLAADGGPDTLVTVRNANYTLNLQKVHIEVTTTGAFTWTFQDSAGTPVPLVPSISTAAIAHFDFDFGPKGIPLTLGKNLVLSISGAGAVGWVAWEGYSQLANATAVASV